MDRFGQVSGDFSLERHGARGAFGTVATSSPLFGGIQISGAAPFDPLSLNPILAFEASRSMLAAGDGAAENLDLVATFENLATLNGVETGSAYGTTIGGSLSGSTVTYNQVAPAVAGEYYRIRFTASNVAVRGRVRYRNYAGGADITAVNGLGSLEYFYADGAYEAYVPSDDGLSIWFYAQSGWDYSGVSVQQISQYPANATQTTASKQPRAHVPVGGGHLYIPNVSNNYATGPSVTIGANETWEGEVDMMVTDFGPSWNYLLPMGGGEWVSGFGLIFYYDGDVRPWSKGSVGGTEQPSGVALNTPFNAKYGFDGTNLYVDIDDVRVFTGTASTEQSNSITHPLELNQQTLTQQGDYIIQKAKLTVGSSVVFDCDFSASNIVHGDTSFQAAVGGTVNINTSGNDPAMIVRRPFLRFDGVNNFLTGSFKESNTTGGYMFVVYSVNGNGGEDSGRVFVMNSAGEAGYNNNRSFMWSLRKSNDNNIAYYHSYTWRGIHTLGFDPADGTLLHEVKAVDGSQFSKVNNGDIQTSSLNLSSLSSEEFDIGGNPAGISNPAIDIEYLYLFDHTLTDNEAKKVRDHLNAKSSIY